jgi:murein DD-endopeptidase MepM/ murein hydrolase activator NlpD
VRATGLAVGPSSRLIDGALGPAPDRPLPDAGGRWPLRPQLAWHEVVGTIGEDRGDGKGEPRNHFHDGLDVRGDVGQEVVAIAAGKVSNPVSTYGFGQINEGLSIGSLGYVHMHVGRGAHGAARASRSATCWATSTRRRTCTCGWACRATASIR